MKMKVFVILALVAAASAALPISEEKKGKPGRIFGGTEAAEAEFPFMVSIQGLLKEGWIEYCGGAIYDETRVLTSGFGFVLEESDWELSQFRVVAGDSDLSVDSGKEQIRNISSIEFHPDFDFNDEYDGWDNDILILTLSAPLAFNPRVQPIRLAKPTFKPSATGVTTGFGTAFVDGSFNGKLRKATLDIIDLAECSAIYSNWTVVYPKPFYPITETHLCAQSGEIKSCMGDNGTPLVVRDSATGGKYLAGILSWSARSCNPNLPNVYTNIASASVSEWLHSKLSPCGSAR